MTNARHAYASVNGLRMYYEVQGSGDPLVLLHGGVTGIAGIAELIPALAGSRQVIALELQGHGRTADIERPLRFETMADDVAALIRHLGLESADLMGYSLGGGTALQCAVRHPDVVRRLVVVSQPCKRAGWYPEVLEAFDQMGPATAEPLRHSPFAGLYPEVDWASLFAKLGELLRTQYDWSEAVAGIMAPMLLVFADADAVRLEHVAEFYGLLGGGRRDAGVDGARRPAAQLGIIPGCTHYDICSATALPLLVTRFLGAAGGA